MDVRSVAWVSIVFVLERRMASFRGLRSGRVLGAYTASQNDNVEMA